MPDITNALEGGREAAQEAFEKRCRIGRNVYDLKNKVDGLGRMKEANSRSMQRLAEEIRKILVFVQKQKKSLFELQLEEARLCASMEEYARLGEIRVEIKELLTQLICCEERLAARRVQEGEHRKNVFVKSFDILEAECALREAQKEYADAERKEDDLTDKLRELEASDERRTKRRKVENLDSSDHFCSFIMSDGQVLVSWTS